MVCAGTLADCTRLSKRRICATTCSRRCEASGGVTLWRSCTPSSSSGAAARTSGFMPLPSIAFTSAGTPDGAAAGAPARGGAGAGAGAPGRCCGSTTVRSSCMSSKGPLGVFMSASPDRPQLQVETGEFVAEMEGDAAGALQFAPHRRMLVELEIQVAGVVWDLARRNRHRIDRDAGQLQVHKVPDLLHRTDL